jgi:hypothetical protein
MTTLSPYLEKIYNQIVVDLSSFLFKMLKDYPGHEAEMVRLMTGQLGSLIAVATKDPEKALPYYAQILAKFDWEAVRRDYFANTLGVDTTIRTDKPLCEVKSIGHGNSIRSDQEDGQHRGDPARQKPEDA